MTLVVFINERGRTAYMLPDDYAKVYDECDGCILNLNECPAETMAKTEHLAYMLGEEPYYGNGSIPLLSEFLERVKGEEVASPIPGDEKPAPWEQYRVCDPVTDFSLVSRLIVCGWLV